jgi:nucleotide-binding universal stress UspA family protein
VEPRVDPDEAISLSSGLQEVQGWKQQQAMSLTWRKLGRRRCDEYPAIRILRQGKAMKILLAVDGSPYTRRMLAYLGAHKGLWAADHSITVLYVVLPVPHRAAAFAGPDIVHGFYEDDARVVLDPVRTAMAEEGLEAKFVHTVGHPAEEIASYAESGKFDLVVMGSSGHGALKNLVLGSVASKVLARCTVPVLLVR